MDSNEPLPSGRATIQYSASGNALFRSDAQPPAVETEDIAADAGMMVKRSLAALLRYKWLVVAIVLVVGVAAFFIRKQFSAVYQAEGKVWISPEGQSQRGPVRAAALLPSNSWGDLLVSYAVLGKTVRELHLYVQPTNPAHNPLFSQVDVAEFVHPGLYILRVDDSGARYTLSVNGRGGEAVVERGAVGDSIGKSIGLKWVPDRDRLLHARTIPFSLMAPRQAALEVRSQLHAELPREGNLMRISVTGEDGWRDAMIVNSLQRHLVQTADEFKRRNLTDVRKTLETQLAYAGNALRDADDALERFRMQTITLPSEAGTPINAGIEVTRNPVITNFFNMKLSHESVQRERAALEQTLNEIQRGQLDVQALWQVLPTESGTQEIGVALQEYARKEAELRNDLLAFTEDYEGVKQVRASLLQMKEQTIPRMVTSLITQLRRREDDLGHRIGAESAGLREIPPRTIEEVRLTRNVEARTQLYSMLRSRYEEAQLAELSVQPDLSILDTASMPETPISNRGRQFFFLAVLGSFAGAVGLAIVLDQLDKRIRYIQQIPRRLGLNILGAVAHVVQGRKTDPLNVARLVESFRALRLNVTYAAAHDRPLKLTVTSAATAEGKSLVSANLALSFAEGGYRTLLIDGDLRRGTLHRTFNTERRPGLVDVLRDTITLSECLRPTTHAKLSLLPGGSRSSAAPDLLASESFHRLIEELQTDFDVILIDSPPLVAGMDPHALCVATGNVLFVVRLGETDGSLARQKLDLLHRFPVRLLGTVVNDVRASVGLNTEYSYLPAYAVQDDDDLIDRTALTIR